MWIRTTDLWVSPAAGGWEPWGAAWREYEAAARRTPQTGTYIKNEVFSNNENPLELSPLTERKLMMLFSTFFPLREF